MAQIQVANLTFCYEGSFDNIFEDVSFSIDTNWKLGFIGRNGRGKTTFLQLLLGKHAYTGTISAPRGFDYFPYRISEEMEGRCVSDFAEELKKFQPSLEVEDIEGAVYQEDLTDMTDILREMIEQTK